MKTAEYYEEKKKKAVEWLSSLQEKDSWTGDDWITHHKYLKEVAERKIEHLDAMIIKRKSSDLTPS